MQGLFLDCRVQSVLVPLVQTEEVHYDHGLQWSIQEFAYFGRTFLIGCYIFRREKPFADEEHSANFREILPETSKSSAFWDMGVNSTLKWLPLFSPDEASGLDGTSLGLFPSSHTSSSFLVPSLVHVVCEWGAIWRSSHTLGAGYQGYLFPRSFLSLTFASH